MTLTAVEIKHAKPGMHADGQGLYLRVQERASDEGLAKSWIFRFQLGGRRREMGLGTLADLPAPRARALAADQRALLLKNVDPIEARNLEAKTATEAEASVLHEASTGVTFKAAATEFIATHSASWKNVKHGQQWTNTLATYAYPSIGEKKVADVNSDDVLHILKPIWTSKTETATRVRSRIELVLSFAKARKWRAGENPATWRGHLDALLPKPGKVRTVQHHPALPFSKMEEFMRSLAEREGFGARALEFAILTSARSGEVRLMRIEEIDFDSALWTVPAKRMKAGRKHIVPLSRQALRLLKSLPTIEDNPYVFPGEKERKPLSDMTLSAAILRMNTDANIDPAPWIDPQNKRTIVPHGFRSSFNDWVVEATEYPPEMAQMALAHVVADKVEAAYRRGTMFERRRALMQAWADWCLPTAQSTTESASEPASSNT